jgi:acyl dehydratase
VTGPMSNGQVQRYHGIADLEAAIGQEIGPTDWFTVDQARINGFAERTSRDPDRATLTAGP